ncbi:DUF1654 domain-containing protein [Pseudomonas nitroreducens]|uniref:DUF1654 domain-containing protein n=1 Tax=Pseudomonas nitroreducens TaxID=46680 RepID=UPI001FB80620|nr:DUF1654 domain-containing protein [Pseudomonas nitroreducens]MCJ1879659.1 DUF1654 domain-containing protein [Pseudomonas nitroreducens]MCJ1896820.1 DUF1654 domain-containing protein [Pseudomonas nitroreducens]
MTKQAVSAPKESGIHELDRLRLRISAMVGSSKAQADRRAVIWRLDSDTDEAWTQVMEELAETDGLTVTILEDGTAVLEWQPSEEGDGAQGEEEELPADFRVQYLHDQPAPF